MKSYYDIDENSNGAILKKAREKYSKEVGKMGQKELAEYLNVSMRLCQSLGTWKTRNT